MKDICYLSNKSQYVDKEGQIQYVFEVIAGELDKTSGFISGGNVHRIKQEQDTLPDAKKFGMLVECDVVVKTFFDVENKQEKTSIRYSNPQPYTVR